ncbi:bifunctional diguanylate cyclase/phosphodiesterase [Mycobacterium sp. M26]|uniref:putative bifunctional diguanylate cyclase/phosphodiesterase n=1 Tax=Mycobacterium sp. M26 TaxID=1762962 RepID=UPI001E2E0C64|nr:bifunctional diguanylate cyclase/phosphodiesterase [Mycobacterium sp. M26]
MAAVSGAVFVAFVVWILSGVSQGKALATIDDIVLLVLTLPAAFFSAIAARSAQGRLRRAWLAITVGLVAWGIGEAIWTYYELVLDQVPFPSIADAAYLVFPVAACAALLLFPSEHAGPFRGRVFLDGLIVAGSLFLVSWVTILGPLYFAGGTDRLGFVVSLAYPVSDVVVLTLAAVVLVRAGPEHRLTLTLLTVGLACIALSDSLFTYLAAKGEYSSGDVIDIGWAAGLLLIAVAAAASRQTTHEATDAPELPGWASIWLPYAPLLLAGIIAAAQPVPLLKSAPVEVVAVLLVVAVLARQFLAVRENRRLLATVAQQALRDPLTGLANRALFNERLDHAMELRERDGTTVSVVAVDLNDFKLVNDNLGHPVGDELLVGVSNRLMNSIRAGDTVARIGGDEFSVLVEGSADAAHLVAHRVSESFDLPFRIAGHELLMRPSIGLAVAEPDEATLTADELLTRADTAMYSAKRARLHGVQTYHPEMQLTVPADMFVQTATTTEPGGVAAIQLLADLRQAIADGSLTLVYQPKFDLMTSRIVSVEALLRWPRPGGEILTPEEFLPLVRRHGLMGTITDFVLNRALDDAKSWHAASIDLPVAINLFAPSLANLGIPAMISRALSQRGLSPAAVTVEITEDLFLDNLERTKNVLEQLRHNGIRIAIDDFGSGYSALSYLRDLPIDEVKLDRTFIAPILVDPRAAAVVRAVISLADELGLSIVAEGIEDAETVAWLRDHGCQVGQGFFLSPPLASATLTALLANDSPAGCGAHES